MNFYYWLMFALCFLIPLGIWILHKWVEHREGIRFSRQWHRNMNRSDWSGHE
jgi:hypothetical protein